MRLPSTAPSPGTRPEPLTGRTRVTGGSQPSGPVRAGAGSARGAAAGPRGLRGLESRSALVPEILFGEGELLWAPSSWRRPQSLRAVAGEHGLTRSPRGHWSALPVATFARGLCGPPKGGPAGRSGAALSRAFQEARELLSFAIFKQPRTREAQGDRRGANRDFLSAGRKSSPRGGGAGPVYRAAEGLRPWAGGRGRQVYERLARRYAALATPPRPWRSRPALRRPGRLEPSCRNDEDLYRANPGARGPQTPSFARRAPASGRRSSLRQRGSSRNSRNGFQRIPGSQGPFRQESPFEPRGGRGRRPSATARPGGRGCGRGGRLPAQAALALGKLALGSLAQVKLAGDLEEALARKEAPGGSARPPGRAASLPFAETLTEAPVPRRRVPSST